MAGLTLEPQAITNTLKLQPTLYWSAKDKRSHNKLTPKFAAGEVYGFGCWILRTENAKRLRQDCSEDHVQYLLQVLNGQRSNFKLFRELGYKVNFSIFWEADYFVTSEIFPADLLAQLDSFKTDVVLDVYF